MGALRSVPAVWTGWVIARLITAYLIFLEPNPLGDVYYYHFGVFGDDPSAMTEYPHAGTWPAFILAHFIGEDVKAYFFAFPLMVLVFDALFMALVLRRHPTTRAAIDAAWLWVFFGTAVGHVFVLRLDIFPALAVAAAASLLFKHPGFSGALLAFATAMKLWPAVLGAGLVGGWNKAKTWASLAVFVATLLSLGAFTYVTEGKDRLFSPLDYQQVRGLQIESVAATPLMWKYFFYPERWEVFYAPSKSFEITGPGVDTAIAVANVLMLSTLAVAILFALYRFVLGAWTPESALALFVTLILLLIISNKVFSPQYVTWLGPTLVVALSRGNLPRAQQGLVWALAVIAVICGALGVEVFPFGYSSIWKYPGENILPTLALVSRNILVVLMVPLALTWLGLSCRRPRITRAYLD
ncbi:hypothetical protein CPHO_05420 [Corynebacterium phocae]|uniref:DUF2029 domain-containing protein n=1 Tax=Corynebacterium phocae TaxID=161895 RepID=A0A1L7D6B4_9CORY|nr:hypothetical protein CPHO_05420 [Corynebacterium phocae]